jgi:hypothetical protein
MRISSPASSWWSRERNRATLEIFVNQRKAGQVECDLHRPELTQFNIPEGSGFFFPFPSRLAATDQVSVRFRDGSHLENSPAHPQSQMNVNGD